MDRKPIAAAEGILFLAVGGVLLTVGTVSLTLSYFAYATLPDSMGIDAFSERLDLFRIGLDVGVPLMPAGAALVAAGGGLHRRTGPVSPMCILGAILILATAVLALLAGLLSSRIVYIVGEMPGTLRLWLALKGGAWAGMGAGVVLLALGAMRRPREGPDAQAVTGEASGPATTVPFDIRER